MANIAKTPEPQTAEMLEDIINIYKTQNPKKYEVKKEALEAKLEYLKNGGDSQQWDYATWKRTQAIVKKAKEDKKKEDKL